MYDVCKSRITGCFGRGTGVGRESQQLPGINLLVLFKRKQRPGCGGGGQGGDIVLGDVGPETWLVCDPGS